MKYKKGALVKGIGSAKRSCPMRGVILETKADRKYTSYRVLWAGESKPNWYYEEYIRLVDELSETTNEV
jgi:hypothetical protein